MLRRGVVPRVADLIVHPRGKDDVAKILAYCSEQRIAVQTYGGGSSVTFGLRPEHGGVVLAMHTHMNRVLEINETNQTATVEPGLLGPDYERTLHEAPTRFSAHHRYTCGHFPQSFEFSSVGGWIVTLGSGQQSSYYGDMYDIVVGQEYVTPTGSFKTMAFPAAATGPKVNDMMKGSEGAFGVLVSATLKIFRFMPENRKRFAYLFPSWQAAVAAAREISQAEFGMPSVFRISDPEETDTALRLYGMDWAAVDRILGLRGLKRMQRSLLLGTSDGEKSFARNVKRQVGRICKGFGATYLTGYPVRQWERGRYTDPYMREDLMDFGIVIDTLESSVTWDNFDNLYQGVRNFIKSRPNTVCLTHGSHFYAQGANLYFIFILRATSLEEYTSFHSRIIDEIEKHGGSLSHHHGIGKMMAPWMDRHLGPIQMGVLRSLKNYFDPRNIMNPGGTLGLDRPQKISPGVDDSHPQD